MESLAMTKDEALKLTLEALENHIEDSRTSNLIEKLIAAIKEALAQPEQKYRRGNRLICLETEEYCVIHISGTDRQWVKFPDSNVGIYTNEQVAELFELLPKEPEQEPVAYGTWDTMLGKGNRMMMVRLDKGQDGCTVPLYTTPPQRTWVGLTPTQVKLLWGGVQEEAVKSGDSLNWVFYMHINEALKEKNR